MELIKIVDEQGNYTGTIMDKEKAHNLNLFYWAVGIFIVNNKKQVLLQKRSANKKIKPNMWAMCAGHVRVEDEFIIQEEELSEVKWFNIDDVIDMIKCKDESIVFKQNRIHLFEKIKEECDK